MRDFRTIYLIRHGRPAYPDRRKFCLGRTDWPLSEQGAKEAKALGDWFADRPLSAVYTSPLTRCYQTALYLSAQPQVVQDLREIDMGQWDGLPFDEIQTRWPQEYQKRWNDIIGYTIPGGENFVQLQQRVWRCWQELTACDEGDIAIVAHVGVNRMILATLLDKPLMELFDIRQPSGCVDTIVQRGQDFTVQQIGFEPLKNESR